jgi:hypothetical protein
LLLLVIGIIVASALVSRYLSISWAPYQVCIDLNARKVTAFDRRKKRVLWESGYDPGKLYVSKTRVRTRYSSYLWSALVYGDSQQDLVEYATPSQRKTMLTTGSESYLQGLMEELGKAQNS